MPSASARGQSTIVRPRNTSSDARTGPSGARATPAFATGTRGAGEGSVVGRGLAIASGEAGALDDAGGLGAAVVAGGCEGAGVAARGIVRAVAVGEGRAASRVSASSWKNTMFTDKKPAAVSTKSS